METKENVAAAKSSANSEAIPYAPRALSTIENTILTIKVIGILAIIGLALWGISIWTSVKS
jgi:hypothetical protein